MINREEFERYLCNKHGCKREMQRDATLYREAGGRTYYATFGNHARREVHKGDARSLVQNLGFTAGSAAYIQICQDWDL